MPRCNSFFKPVALILAIGVAVIAQVSTGQAADNQKAYFAGGCFWCVEKDFESVPGVIEVISGFTGGDVANPKYKQVVKGGTGHIEAVEIIYDAEVVSYDELLHLFFRSVDPTDSGGQFCDRGHSYTTAIFVSNAAEKAAAEAAKLSARAELGMEIVTPIRDAGPFFAANDYHQDFYKQPKKIITRFGPTTKAKAYKRYRKACGRDARVKELWGSAAPFAGT